MKNYTLEVSKESIEFLNADFYENPFFEGSEKDEKLMESISEKVRPFVRSEKGKIEVNENEMELIQRYCKAAKDELTEQIKKQNDIFARLNFTALTGESKTLSNNNGVSIDELLKGKKIIQTITFELK